MNLGTLTENGLNANLIDEVSETLTYLGFAKDGDKTKCAIQKIIKTDTVTEILCPGNGNFDFLYNWDQRAAYNNYGLKRL